MRKKQLEEQITTLEMQIKSLTEENERLKYASDDFEAKFKKAKEEKELVNKKIAELEKIDNSLEINDLKDNLITVTNEIQRLKAENDELLQRISSLNDESSHLRERLISEKTVVKAEIAEAELEDVECPETPEESVIDAGATAIGEVVVRAAQFCSEIKNSAKGNTKELVNLALGRAEVFKNEVLQASGKSDAAQKIKELKENAFDYFESLKKQ